MTKAMAETPKTPAEIHELISGLRTFDQKHFDPSAAMEEAADTLEWLIQFVEWKPMADAPKDGTQIVIIREVENQPEITEWCVQDNWKWEQVDGDIYRKVRGDPYEFWNGNGHRATHFVPLPPPPVETGKEEA